MIIVRILFRNFSGAVVGSVGSVKFQIVPCFSLYLFSGSIGPLQCLANTGFYYRVLLCCTCHFQSGSIFVYFGFLCLRVSSVSNFHPDARGRRWPLTQAHFSCVVEREGHCKQILLACVWSACSVWSTLGLPQLKAACASWFYTAQSPGARVTVQSGPCISCTSKV